MSLKQILDQRRDDILTKFVREVVRKDLSPAGLSRSVLVDHLPTFLDEIAAELDRAKGPRPQPAELSTTARQHGEQRWKSGYDLEAVVHEYDVLRRAILLAATEAGEAIDSDETEVLSTYLNLGVREATAEYVRASEARLEARREDLEFLCEAGELLASSLDYQSTLTRLTRLLVPRLGDCCIVHLDGHTVDETPLAHIDPAKVELLRDALRHFPPSEGAHGHAQVIQSGKPMLIESTPPGLLESIAQSPEHLALLHELAPCSWLVVPLKIKSNTFGTVTLAWSESGRHYEHADLLLVEDLARRASTAIDNARLFELARDERARAEAATRTKDEFVAVVSHELRTPLNVIIGWVRLLRSGSLTREKQEHALEVVERNANAQSQLVADLLDISRAITGKVRLNPAQVDFANLIRMVLEDARFAIEVKRLQLHVDLGSEGTVIRGDADRLKQVVGNLLLNAVKFTPKDGRVWISLRRVESDLELVVRDTGIGIAAEFLPHVFDTFRQSDSKTTRAHSGLGIGLSIAKHLVDLHGGSIEAASDGINQGARFTVRLPVSSMISTTVGIAKVPSTVTRRKSSAAEPTLDSVTVLVVDDEEDARELLRIVLESSGMVVHEAGSARDALSLIQSEQVDLLVSDIGMPEEDGYALIRSVRALANKEKASIPAVALTAFTRIEDRNRALLEGFNVHMGKPVEPAELLSTLADLVGPRRSPA